MKNKKTLDELLNEATEISKDREERIKKNALEKANKILKESTTKLLKN